MSIFDNRKEIARRELRKELKRTPIRIGGKNLSRKERVALEKEVFSSKLGGRISKGEYKGALEKFRKSRFERVHDEKLGGKRKRTFSERRFIAGKRKALRKLGGI